MDESEFRELLRLVITRVQEEGLGELNERILNQLQFAEGPPSTLLLEYLSLLRGEWSLRSRAAVRRTVHELNRTVEAEDGEGITGIELALTGVEERVYEGGVIDLTEAPDLDEALGELDELLGDLAENRDSRG